jgi:hypothetical protein
MSGNGIKCTEMQASADHVRKQRDEERHMRTRKLRAGRHKERHNVAIVSTAQDTRQGKSITWVLAKYHPDITRKWENPRDSFCEKRLSTRGPDSLSSFRGERLSITSVSSGYCICITQVLHVYQLESTDCKFLWTSCWGISRKRKWLPAKWVDSNSRDQDDAACRLWMMVSVHFFFWLYKSRWPQAQPWWWMGLH